MIDRENERETMGACHPRPAPETPRASDFVGMCPVDAPDRATWIWNPGIWRDAPQALIDRLDEAGIDRVFVQLPLGEPAALHALHPLLTRLRAHGVTLIAVEGDPAMISGSGRINALRRAMRLAAFLRESSELITGVQYDVEPYLLQGHAVDPCRSWSAWADLIAELDTLFDAPVSTVVPFWMIDDAAAQSALAATATPGREFVVMAYRTDRAVIASIADAWLARMAPDAVMVRIALDNESGPAHVSFDGASARLLATADDIFTRLRSRPGFSGLACHALLDDPAPASPGAVQMRSP
jgi:hypothetical protein